MNLPDVIVETCPEHGSMNFQYSEAAQWWACPGFATCTAAVKLEDRYAERRVTQRTRTHGTHDISRPGSGAAPR